GPFAYGGPTWHPVVGDWDGNGTFTPGVVNPVATVWYLRDVNSGGDPTVAPFVYNPAPTPLIAGMVPVGGDWDGNGTWTVGTFDMLTGTWALRSTNTSDTTGTVTFAYGAPGWLPVVGDWDGNGTTT